MNNKNESQKNEMPIKMNVVYESDGRNTIRIWNAQYRGLPCYCVEHKSTGHIEIIDKNDDVVNAIVAKIKRTGCLVIDKNGASHMLKFHRSGTEKGITLRLFVFAQYNGIKVDKMRKAEISLYDRSLFDFDITDLRSGNLYNASEFCPVKNGWEVLPLTIPGVKSSIIRVKAEKYGAVEFLDYSSEMLHILGTGSMCCASYNRYSKRIAVGLRTGKGNSITMNLSRFAGIFGQYFSEYRFENDPIKSFLNDLPILAAEMQDQYDHINASKFNSCRANLFPMQAIINQRKSDGFRKFLSVGVKVIAVVNGNGEILIEYQTPDKFKLYYKCQTAEDFLDWQKVFLGLDKMTENTRILDKKNRRWVWLREVFKRRTAETTYEEKEQEMFEWCIDRDRLYAMEQNKTVEFRNYSKSIARSFGPVAVSTDCNIPVMQVVNEEMSLLGQKLPKGTIVIVTKMGDADNGAVSV